MRIRNLYVDFATLRSEYNRKYAKPFKDFVMRTTMFNNTDGSICLHVSTYNVLPL